jgi:hypothetical protein
MEQKFTIQGLYYRYGESENGKINDVLSRVKLVKSFQKNPSGDMDYYQLKEDIIKEIIKNPRHTSPNFANDNIEETPINGLEPFKKITYLVKSSSRFFYKPDVGEIIDQIRDEDLYDSKLKAICITGEYEGLDDTGGEHFLAEATLLKEI